MSVQRPPQPTTQQAAAPSWPACQGRRGRAGSTNAFGAARPQLLNHVKDAPGELRLGDDLLVQTHHAGGHGLGFEVGGDAAAPASPICL